jgi:hypothetical protein
MHIHWIVHYLLHGDAVVIRVADDSSLLSQSGSEDDY